MIKLLTDAGRIKAFDLLTGNGNKLTASRKNCLTLHLKALSPTSLPSPSRQVQLTFSLVGAGGLS